MIHKICRESLAQNFIQGRDIYWRHPPKVREMQMPIPSRKDNVKDDFTNKLQPSAVAA